MRIIPCTSIGQEGWLACRQALWPDTMAGEHLAEMRTALGDPDRYAQFMASATNGRALGFAEAALRMDYVNGTDSTPVAFVEGLYVTPEYRRQGIGTLLIVEVILWARAHGCTELASDALLDNEVSQEMHRSLGFEETERVVFFRKLI
ncbi:aminoglycoside 6'-N-acetyltransferase I [Pseudoduganella lurida]|uniref:Aminoglycoside N(6')-acetyltransferase type 1 n=1 Tax=Pseudoduganella lurida TaxID=1036180 RepID=A0A562R8P0_9BURK|nr:aminoglycoside 6'-N-acetyltransferase [Pseudoduganella lurida]TWI65407.1 aminoglycoside 6'-N-acetyltransferase I [Pseudoduganella lurida]